MLRPPYWFILAILLVGVGLRTAAFASERSLWIDEAMVALNVVDRSPTRLLEPLDRNQGAPVGFLLATKASVALSGPTERALRLPAFLASLAGLAAFGLAAHRLLPLPAARLALALFAVSPHLVSYGAECKQYSGDAAFAAGLLAVSAPFFLGPVRRRNWLAFASIGALAVWCSHPALFVLAGLGLALFGQARVNGDRRRLAGLILLGAAWGASFAAVYLVNLRHLGHNDYLARYWAGRFAPPPTSRSGAAWFVDHGLAFLHYPAGLTAEHRFAGLLVGAVGLVGVAGFWRLSRGLAFAFALTAGFAVLASGVRLYPFAGRLLLFLVPMAYLVWASGSDGLAARCLGPRGRVLGWLVAIWPVMELVDEFRSPARTEEIRPMLHWVESNRSRGDRIYVYGGAGDAGAGPAFDFYAPRYDIPTEGVVRGGVHRDDPAKYREEIAALPPGRIWVLFTHRQRDEESVIRAGFDEVGTGHRALEAPGASLYLYELRPHSPP